MKQVWASDCKESQKDWPTLQKWGTHWVHGPNHPPVPLRDCACTLRNWISRATVQLNCLKIIAHTHCMTQTCHPRRVLRCEELYVLRDVCMSTRSCTYNPKEENHPNVHGHGSTQYPWSGTLLTGAHDWFSESMLDRGNKVQTVWFHPQ